MNHLIVGFSQALPWALGCLIGPPCHGAVIKKLENPPLLIYNNTMNKEIKTFTPGRCDED
jgi:hypothetical protein